MEPATAVQKREVNLFNAFSGIASLALIVFGLAQLFVYHQPPLGLTELISGIAVGVNALLFLLIRKLAPSRVVLIAIVFAVLMALLLTGGIEGTGIFWFFMFPPAVFFMAGRKTGTISTLLLYGATIYIALLEISGQIALPYHSGVIRQMWAVLLVITGLVYLYEFNREHNERNLREQEKRIKTLYEITTRPDLMLADQFRAALKLGSETLFTKLAILSRIENRKFTVLYCAVPPDTIKEGDEFLLDQTYCDITVKKQEVLAIDHMLTSEYKAHPCYGKFKLESYIGVPIMVNGGLYGTLNFSSPDPHHPEFSESDRDFVRLMGKWVSWSIERELLAEKQKEIDRMKSEFVSVASHQLRTPLTGIKWFGELLLKDKAGPLSPEQKDFITQMYESNDRMIKLVEDLLNVSRIETGTKFVIVKKPTDVIALIDSLASDLIGLAHAHQVTIKKTENMPKELLLPVDADKIRQVFANLMSNAVKYSNANGEVIIGCDTADKDTITFTIKDTGLGIPQKAQSRMFEKFFRAENVQTKETDGTGLGMYIAKAIVEAHGGAIRFESEENKGTTFFMQLPR